MDELVITNPYTGAEVGRVARQGIAEVNAAVEKAKEAARELRRMPLHRRAAILIDTGNRLRADAEPMARLMVSETGKTIREARAEVERAAQIFTISGEEARRLNGETLPLDGLPNGEGRIGYWTREPVGIVGAITPWNVPLALSAHKIGPALAGGNAVIHKPAEQTPLNALRLAQHLHEAGLPPNALQTITGMGEDAGDALVTHPDVGFVSFTGSRDVGMRLPARAGYKRVALELGGNSPVIVMESANLSEAASAIVRGGFAVAGQLCISVQRILVQRSIQERLTAEIVTRVRALQLGDPNDETTDVGTLIGTEACDRVEREIATAKAAGARVIVGGERLGNAIYVPTVLSNVPADASLAVQEAFAPLVLLLPFDTLDEAIAIANATPYGLNAGIYTENLREAFAAARDIEAGSVMINDVPTFRSDLMPYGGRKGSGLGREGVRFALEEMTEPKVVVFQTGN